MGSSASWALGVATFVAAVVEAVEALTIVLAMGITRGWKSAFAGVAAALVALVAFTAVAGYALATWLPEAALQLTVGTLLLIFGLQWLRKAVLRSSGRKSLHDEGEAFAKQTDAGRGARSRRFLDLDSFGFVVTFKGVFLEGAEVVFIVITFGLNAKNVPVAVVGASAAILLVSVAGFLVHAPLTRVPENTLKYAVGLLLATFGTFWATEGLGALRAGRESLKWPGGEIALLAVLAAWFVLSRVLINWLQPSTAAARRAGHATAQPVPEEV